MGNRYRYSEILVLAIVLLIGDASKVSGSHLSGNISAKVSSYQDDRDVKQMQKVLLGPYHDIRSLTTGNIAHAYITFLENARAQQANWSSQEWKAAKIVIQKLDSRKSSMDGLLKVADKSRIMAVQAEFRGMEAKVAAKN